MGLRGIQRTTLVAAAVLAVLLVVAGVFIVRGINRLSRSEYERQSRFVSLAMSSLRRDLAGSFLDLARSFELSRWPEQGEDLRDELAEHYQMFEQESPLSGLIDQLSLVEFRRDAPVRYFQFDRVAGSFLEEPLPESLSLRDRLTPPPPGPRPGRPTRVEPRLHAESNKLFIELPYLTGRQLLRRGRGPMLFGRPPGPGSEPGGAGGADLRPGGILVLLGLDPAYLKEEIFRPLQEIYFGGPLLSDVELAVFGESPADPIYQSDPGLDPSFFSSFDRSLPLVGQGGWLSGFREAPGSGPRRGLNFRQTGRLTLLTRHRMGSLLAAVERQRRFDLLKAFGILLLLAGTGMSLLWSVERARRLARRQMDFVAGISHELRNPLAALQSAGFNLSQGTVREPGKIRQYGQMISRESRRLSQMVEQVLSYAGIENSGVRYTRQFLQLEEVLEAVLKEYGPIFEQEEWKVKVTIGEKLPAVYGDRKAFESCFRNLLDNALKYASEGQYLELQVGSAERAGKRRVEIEIQDRGNGIPTAELASIFDPFYRGRDQVASTTPGAGLGLALVRRHVEAHGGTIQAYSAAGKGSRFVLSLPIADRSEGTNQPEEKNHGSTDTAR
jgi:signal transduction histidine kinase